MTENSVFDLANVITGRNAKSLVIWPMKESITILQNIIAMKAKIH